VKVYPTTDDPEKFETLKTCYLKGAKGEMKPLTITGCSYFKGLVILGFEEIQTIDDAIPLRQKELYCDRENAVPLEEGEYYLADIIGCEVFDEDGNKLGVMEDYLETAAQDVYKIRRDNGKEFLVPAVDAFIKEVDVAGGRMVIHVIPGMID
jgi:16S rRNA processing protein RimM